MVAPHARPRLFDAALTAVFAAGAVWEAVLIYVPSVSRVSGSLVMVAAAVALLWRRTRPIPVVLLAGLALCVPAVLGPTTETITGSFVLMVAVYSMVVYGPGWRRIVGPAVLITVAICYRSYGDYGVDA